MQSIDINNPAERKKLFWAIGLGTVAIIFLWWTFIGFGSQSRPNTAVTPKTVTTTPTAQPRPDISAIQKPGDLKANDLLQLHPIDFVPTLPPLTEARRNIFAFYEPPPPTQKVAEVPQSTPTPTPPVLLAGVSPSTVFARTGDFTLEATGDKFTNELKITFDGQELPTHYSGPQQLSANVPASAIVNAGPHQIVLRSSDGRLYSNPIALNVSQAPTPNYNYVGILGTVHHVDTAILQDRSSREIMNVQKGDVLAGRFRVTSISEKELVLVDTNLKIKHTLPFTVEGERSYNPLQRPTPKVDSEDDEP